MKRIFLLLITSLLFLSSSAQDDSGIYGYWVMDHGDGTYQAMYLSEQNHCYMSGTITSTEDLRSKVFRACEYKYFERDEYNDDGYLELFCDPNDTNYSRLLIGNKRGGVLTFIEEVPIQWAELNVDPNSLPYYLKVQGPEKFGSVQEWLTKGKWMDGDALYGYPGYVIDFEMDNTFHRWSDGEDTSDAEHGHYKINGEDLVLISSDGEEEIIWINHFKRSIYGYHNENEESQTSLVGGFLFDEWFISDSNLLLMAETDIYRVPMGISIKRYSSSYNLYDYYNDHYSLMEIKPLEEIHFAIKNGYELYDGDTLVGKAECDLDEGVYVEISNKSYIRFSGHYGGLQ